VRDPVSRIRCLGSRSRMSARPFGGLRPVGCRVPFGHHGSSGAAGTRSADAKFTNSGFAASLQGFVPLAGWGLVHGSPRSTSPGSPGFLPPWGLPLPWPRSPLDAESSSQVLRARSRSGFLFPVLQSFKEPGSRPGLSRGCLPLRGFRPRPVFRRLPERSTGVGPMPTQETLQPPFIRLITVLCSGKYPDPGKFSL
jgi:hypothetical protein